MRFKSWLSKQSRRNDPIGDIARDMLEDPCWDGRAASAVKHVKGQAHHASDAALEALDKALAEFRGRGPEGSARA